MLLALFGGYFLFWLLVQGDIEYVLPDGFTGPFIIVVADDGADAVTDRWKYTVVTVPQSGKVTIRDDSFLHESSFVKARYSNGERIPIGGIDTETSFALWMGGWSSGQNLVKRLKYGPAHKYFVGSRSEFEEFDFHNFMAEPMETSNSKR